MVTGTSAKKNARGILYSQDMMRFFKGRLHFSDWGTFCFVRSGEPRSPELFLSSMTKDCIYE